MRESYIQSEGLRGFDSLSSDGPWEGSNHEPRRSRFYRCSGAALLAFAFAAFPVAAQQDRATIEGLVMDSSGALIADAQVSVVHLETNDEVLLRTNGTGRYFAPNLPIGSYRVTVTRSGFNTTMQDRIQLQAQASVRVDFTLSVGNVSETVTVQSAAPLVDASTATITATLLISKWRICGSSTWSQAQHWAMAAVYAGRQQLHHMGSAREWR